MTQTSSDTTAAISPSARVAMKQLEAVHVVSYFAPETFAAYKQLGHRGMQGYFASRSAPMGAVPGEVTLATFYVFAPGLVMRAVPSCWSLASPDQTLAARHDGVLAALRRCAGDVDPAELDEAVALVREACSVLDPVGRPLFAGHASLPWPDEPLLALWHGATLLREHRGDGHMQALLHAGLDPVESMVVYAAEKGGTQFLVATRGWGDDEWATGRARCLDRGLVDADGALTPEGAAVRAGVESTTDRLSAAGWQHLGDERATRLHDLVKPWSRALAKSGVFGGAPGK